MSFGHGTSNYLEDQHLHCRCRVPQESLQEFLGLGLHQWPVPAACWRLGLHQWPVMPAVHQRPVMPTGDAAGWLRVRLAFGHSQTQEPLALAYAPFA